MEEGQIKSPSLCEFKQGFEGIFLRRPDVSHALTLLDSEVGIRFFC